MDATATQTEMMPTDEEVKAISAEAMKYQLDYLEYAHANNIPHDEVREPSAPLELRLSDNDPTPGQRTVYIDAPAECEGGVTAVTGEGSTHAGWPMMITAATVKAMMLAAHHETAEVAK